MHRPLVFISVVAGVAILLGGVLIYFGPASLQANVEQALTSASITNKGMVPFTMLQSGTDATSITDRTNYRINNATDLATLWPLIYGEKGAAPMPTVDFSKYEILAIFDGSHSQGGYSVSVKSVADENAVRTVTINHEKPGSTCTVPNTPTNPFVIIEVPKTEFSLSHDDVMGMNMCS
jgi:hypothetical protein